MEAALAALSGAASTTPLRFEPNLPFGSGVGAWLHRLVHFVAGEVEHDVNPFASPAVGARLADTVIYGLLQGHPHNHSARLASGRSAEPRYVREAAEYLEAHAADPVRMADLARLTGVGVRALQLGFQKSRGCSPMEFFKEQRLHLARRKLVGGARLTVTVPTADFSPCASGSKWLRGATPRSSASSGRSRARTATLRASKRSPHPPLPSERFLGRTSTPRSCALASARLRPRSASAGGVGGLLASRDR